MLDALLSKPKPQDPSPAPQPAQKAAYDLVDLKVRLHQKLLDVLNLAALDKLSRERAEVEIGAATRDLLAQQPLPLTAAEKNKLALEIVDEVALARLGHVGALSRHFVGLLRFFRLRDHVLPFSTFRATGTTIGVCRVAGPRYHARYAAGCASARACASRHGVR